MTIFSAEKFNQCLERARLEGIRMKKGTDGPETFVATSARTGAFSYTIRVGYGLTGTCSCPAGENGKPCKHLAAALSAYSKLIVEAYANMAKAA